MRVNDCGLVDQGTYLCFVWTDTEERSIKESDIFLQEMTTLEIELANSSAQYGSWVLSAYASMLGWIGVEEVCSIHPVLRYF